MNSIFLSEIKKLKNNLFVDKKVWQYFFDLTIKDKNIVRDKKTRKHICCYFLPVNKKTNSIYLVDHIKAKTWIPPGGHIEKNETPTQTINREFVEELDYELTKEKIEFINLSVTNISPPRYDCLVHFDLWYLVYVDKINFKFCKKEFYSASWFEIEKAIKISTRAEYIKILKRLKNYLRA